MGDNHQVHSKPICCLVNGLILLECHVQSDGLASPPVSAIQAGTSRGGRRERRPRLDPLNEGIKAGIERWAPPLPLFVLSCLPKQTHPPVRWKSHGGGPAQRNRWCRGLLLGDTCTLQHIHMSCFLGHLGLLLIRYIITHNYIAYDML